MKTDNGGAAFPSAGVVIDYDKNEHQQGAYEGMSLRDYFAAKAIPALIDARRPFAGGGAAGSGYGSPAMTAREAYAIADAMLAERSK